jgi:2'-5' RNA ligase
MADITPTDVHTPVPLGGKKKRAPGGAFLARLYASLKERMAGAGFLSADEFATVFRGARGHAGGKAKAEKMLMAAEGDYSGVAVVLPVPPGLAQTLALPDGLPAEDLHLTICMLGDTEAMGGVALAEALLAVRDAGLIAGPLTARISGIGRFMGGDQDAIYLSVDSPDLNDLWDIVCDELEEAGIVASEDHGFTPHITLAYIDPGAPVPLDTITEQSITFTQLALWAGMSRTSVPLLGMGDDGDGDVDGAAALPTCPQCGADVIAGADVCMNCGAPLGAAGLMAALGANPDGTPIPNDQLMTELADMAAAGHTHRLFNSIAFAEAPAWIPYLPKPGVYAHPRYGPITITTERNQRFVSNFARRSTRTACRSTPSTRPSCQARWAGWWICARTQTAARTPRSSGPIAARRSLRPIASATSRPSGTTPGKTRPRAPNTRTWRSAARCAPARSSSPQPCARCMRARAGLR